MKPAKQIFVLLLLGAVCFTSAQAQEKKQKEMVIPFRLSSWNNIVVTSVINEKDTVALMVHTAASGVMLTEEAIAAMKTFRIDGKADSIQSWGGTNNAGSVSLHNQLAIGQWKRNDVRFRSDLNSGHETGGKIGLADFGYPVVMFDFDNSTMQLLQKVPRKRKGYKQYELIKDEDGLLFIKAVCRFTTAGDTAANIFLIHSGYSGAVLLDDLFVTRHKAGSKIVITGEKKLQDSFGNVIVSKNGTLPGLYIGSIKIENLPVGFFEGKIAQNSMSLIGGDIIKRFNWIIDLEKKQAWLKPNRLFNAGWSLF